MEGAYNDKCKTNVMNTNVHTMPNKGSCIEYLSSIKTFSSIEPTKYLTNPYIPDCDVFIKNIVLIGQTLYTF